MSTGISLQDAGLCLASLTVFRGLRGDLAVAALRELACAENEPLLRRVERYALFAAPVIEAGGNWSEYLLRLTLDDENAYVRRCAAGVVVPPELERAAENDLRALEATAALTPEAAADGLGEVRLPVWANTPCDFTARFRERLARVGELGYGVFARNHMFRVQGGEILPVPNPDPVSFDRLVGYERERGLITANTRALLEGQSAANTLLYGDSGTGKSTCVKAVANELKDLGLRLVELRSDQLDEIPTLIGRLSANPLKFILFIDDLSFTESSERFTALKAALEGSVAARTENIVIYATSNRRHLVRERFSEREGDDVHVRDTLEELGSLSDRFGLMVTFLRPDRNLYFSIAERYCRRFGVAFDDAARAAAEQFALSRGGRSARAARQFAERYAVEVKSRA